MDKQGTLGSSNKRLVYLWTFNLVISPKKSNKHTVRNATWLVLQCTLFNYRTTRKAVLKELETNQPVWSIGFINVHNTSLFYKEKNIDDKHQHWIVIRVFNCYQPLKQQFCSPDLNTAHKTWNKVFEKHLNNQPGIAVLWSSLTPTWNQKTSVPTWSS